MSVNFFVHLYDFTEEQTHANCDTRDEVKLELTDGWYPIRATLDEHLQGFVKKGKILVRMKFFVWIHFHVLEIISEFHKIMQVAC